MSHKKSPGDSKVAITIKTIINGFFQSNPNVLLYICDTANEQQAERNRLFLRWFNAYNREKEFTIKTEIVRDEGVDNYVSVIVQMHNPRLKAIIQEFDEQVALLRGNK